MIIATLNCYCPISQHFPEHLHEQHLYEQWGAPTLVPGGFSMIGGSQQSFVSADCAETLFLQPRELMSTQSAVLQGLRISGITASITSPKGPNSSFTQSVNYVKQPQTR